ncbi:hypothetical protein BV898_05207 [Hypsibius exemplaris]|uniref:SAP domain-containing protein n=1 Tax=Hypsibius exemplaris TaxID=2072580 RepID=A0A1W0X0A5_HYPEX|nr:hypothetical protein BV898_05207 [Hypsibius exemplaris]
MYTEEDLEKLSADQLSSILKEMIRPSQGYKADLVRRILHHLTDLPKTHVLVQPRQTTTKKAVTFVASPNRLDRDCLGVPREEELAERPTTSTSEVTISDVETALAPTRAFLDALFMVKYNLSERCCKICGGRKRHLSCPGPPKMPAPAPVPVCAHETSALQAATRRQKSRQTVERQDKNQAQQLLKDATPILPYLNPSLF